MSGRLAGKTALITAAGQGMGYACAVQMAAEGATVYATDVNPQLLEQFGGDFFGRRLAEASADADHSQRQTRAPVAGDLLQR